MTHAVFDGVGLAGFKSRANAFLLAWLLASSLPPAVFHSMKNRMAVSMKLPPAVFFSFYGLALWGWGLRTDRVLIALSQICIANIF